MPRSPHGDAGTEGAMRIETLIGVLAVAVVVLALMLFAPGATTELAYLG